MPVGGSGVRAGSSAWRSSRRAVPSRCRRGTSTVEFGLISIPFLIFLLGFIEFVWQATTAVLLDASALRVSRFGATGQPTPPGAPNGVTCGNAISWLVAQGSGGLVAESRLTVTTQTFASATDLAAGTNPTASRGSGGQFVTYTLRYEQPLLSVAWLPLTNGGPNLIHTAVVTVKNEPFGNARC